MAIDRKKLHEVILSSFTNSEFRRLLKFRLGIDSEEIVATVVGFGEVAEMLVDHVVQLGLLNVLIAEMARERPKRDDVQALYREYVGEAVATRPADEDRTPPAPAGGPVQRQIAKGNSRMADVSQEISGLARGNQMQIASDGSSIINAKQKMTKKRGRDG